MTRDEAFWDKIAEGYAKSSAKSKGPNYAARIARAAAIFTPTDRVLEVGCASGEITLDLAAHCGHVLGIDLGGKLIEIARAEAGRRGIENAAFEKIDAMDPALDVPEGGYDAITMYSVIHLVQDPEALVGRLHGLLKPGGHLISETPCLGDWAWFWGWAIGAARLIGKAPSVVQRLKVAELEAMLRDAGFEILESKVYNPKSGQQCITARKG